MSETVTKVALITGAAKRIGAEITRHLHRAGMNVVIHYRFSQQEANDLRDELLAIRPNSAHILHADCQDTQAMQALIAETVKIWGRLDALVNNASSFYPTALGQVEEQQWEELMASNLKGPFFLSQAAATKLAEANGCIVNITDIHASTPLKDYSVYCMAKAGLAMMTKSLAKELAPQIRVNAIAPGAILWPEAVSGVSDATKAKIIKKTPLARSGQASDIAKTVDFLINQAPFITGQTIKVDGGRSLND